MSDVLQVPVSRGYLAKLCNGVIFRVAVPTRHDAPQSGDFSAGYPGQRRDEPEETIGKKHWVWCITAPLFTLFHIAASRGSARCSKS